MNFLDQLKGWFGQSRSQSPEAQAMREALDAGRRAKFSEDYLRALDHLGRAVTIAQEAGDTAAVAVVALHQAEALLRLRRWDEARALLAPVHEAAKAGNQAVQIAYILCVYGMIEQEQGHWAKARAHYEEALSVARSAQAVGAEGRALGHLGDTYLHDGNASYAAHLLRDSLPKLNASGDIELSSYFVGRLGEALIQSGQEVEGHHLLGRALQLAEHIHYRYYERMWALALGERALKEARYHDAYANLAHGLRLFTPTDNSAGHVTALCQMSQVCLSLRDFPQALTYAEDAVRRVNGAEDRLIAMAQGSLGTALRAAGQSGAAIPHLQAAATVYSVLENGTPDRIEVETLRNLAAAQADAGDSNAPATYNRAIEKARLLGEDLELAQTRRDLGLLYARAGLRAQAIQEWSAALAIYDEKRHYAQVARLHTDIANARKGMGQAGRALKDYEQALMTLNSVDENDLETRGLVLSNAANAYVEQGDIESADSFFNEAITIAEKLGDTQAEATRRGNYGWFLLTVGRPRRAISMLEQALRQSQTSGLALQAAVQMSNLGLAYDSIADYGVALTYHRQALTAIDTLNEPRWRAHLSVNLANTLLALGEYDEAERVLRDTLLFSRANNETELISRALVSQGRLAVLRGDPQSAAPLLDEALSLARRADFRRLVAEVLSAQSEQRAAAGRPDEAAILWDEAQRLYGILRMPQAKVQPAWLSDRPVQP